MKLYNHSDYTVFGLSLNCFKRMKRKRKKSFKKYSVRRQNNPNLDRIEEVGTEYPLDYLKWLGMSKGELTVFTSGRGEFRNRIPWKTIFWTFLKVYFKDHESHAYPTKKKNIDDQVISCQAVKMCNSTVIILKNLAIRKKLHLFTQMFP